MTQTKVVKVAASLVPVAATGTITFAVNPTANDTITINGVVFTFIAFLGSLPFSVLLQIIATNIGIKLVMSIISTPTIKLVPRTVDESLI